MIGFYKILIRVKKVIPKEYKRTPMLFFSLSLVLLILDIFSVFLLIPLIISFLDPKRALAFLPITISEINKYLLVSIVLVFFLLKNYIAIRIQNYQTKNVYQLGSYYSLLLSKHYILGNYLTFKQQKKSAIIKDIIFISNDFVVNVLLSINTIVAEGVLLALLCTIGIFFNFTITLLTILLIGTVGYIYKKYHQHEIDKINKTRSEEFDTNISNLTNLLNGYLSIKSSNLFTYFLDKFDSSNKKLNHSYAILQAKRLNSHKQTEIILVCLICFIFISIQIFSLKGMPTIVFLSIFASLAFKSIPSINRLNIAFTNLRAHLYTLEIIEKNTKTIGQTQTLTSPITFNHTIVLKNISFSYTNKNNVLTNVNITIKKGQFIGITGPSGIGKSTLLHVISKLIEPSKGEMYIDGVEITEENKYNYFELFNYLTQKPFIYEGSILDNLFLSQKKYDSKKINTLLKSVKLDDIIMQFSDGLNSYIGIEGNNLSGGQLQRLCILRAILAQPQIIILDEATNHLDVQTEVEVLKFLKTYAKENGITIISVSHHKQDIKHLYDQTIELENVQ